MHINTKISCRLELLDPSVKEEMYERGYHAWNEGYIEQAAECFAQLAIIDPFDRRFIFSFACCLEQQGVLTDAVQLFMHALVMKQDDPFCYFHLACCLNRLGHIIEAREALEATVKLCDAQDDNEFDYIDLQQRASQLLIEL